MAVRGGHQGRCLTMAIAACRPSGSAGDSGVSVADATGGAWNVMVSRRLSLTQPATGIAASNHKNLFNIEPNKMNATY
jgi:hypothetical protein